MGVTHSVNARACCDVGANPYQDATGDAPEFQRPPQSTRKSSVDRSRSRSSHLDIFRSQHRGSSGNTDDPIDVQGLGFCKFLPVRGVTEAEVNSVAAHSSQGRRSSHSSDGRGARGWRKMDHFSTKLRSKSLFLSQNRHKIYFLGPNTPDAAAGSVRDPFPMDGGAYQPASQPVSWRKIEKLSWVSLKSVKSLRFMSRTAFKLQKCLHFDQVLSVSGPPRPMTWLMRTCSSSWMRWSLSFDKFTTNQYKLVVKN